MTQAPRHPVARDTGFSVIELVLVLGMASALAGIAIPRYTHSISHYRATLIAQRVAADLDLARRRALTGGSSETVTFTPGSNQYHIVNMASLDHSANDYVVSLTATPYHAKLISAYFGGGKTVVFDAYGVPNHGGKVVIQAGHFQKTIVLDAASGRATIQ